MWILFNMGNPSILHTADEPVKLRFEDEWPKHLAHVRSTRVEAIDDPLFLGVVNNWREIKLRQLYTWLKLAPPLSPAKMSDATLIEFRKYIRAEIAKQLRFEPSKLPALESY